MKIESSSKLFAQKPEIACSWSTMATWLGHTNYLSSTLYLFLFSQSFFFFFFFRSSLTLRRLFGNFARFEGVVRVKYERVILLWCKFLIFIPHKTLTMPLDATRATMIRMQLPNRSGLSISLSLSLSLPMFMWTSSMIVQMLHIARERERLQLITHNVVCTYGCNCTIVDFGKREPKKKI